jgi:hypothetical protein
MNKNKYAEWQTKLVLLPSPWRTTETEEETRRNGISQAAF